MDTNAYMQATQQRLAAQGDEVSSVVLSGGTALVGYQGVFKMKWAATKLHIFTVVVPVQTADAGGLVGLTREALNHANQTKGKLRGLQTGVAAIPALVAERATPDARQAAEARPQKEFAAFVMPVVVDLAAGQTYSYTGTMVWGAFFASYLRERVSTTFPPPMAAG